MMNTPQVRGHDASEETTSRGNSFSGMQRGQRQHFHRARVMIIQYWCLLRAMTSNPMEVFQKEAPEVAAAFNGLIMSIVASKGIDPKTKQLIYIAMKASMGDIMAVRAHVPMAKAAGATKEEVVDAILMTLTVSGIRGVVTCLPEAVQQFE
jgi:alkylhydroperoxidase/carboxymuconolactone decarboxylase family protein YurZ